MAEAAAQSVETTFKKQICFTGRVTNRQGSDKEDLGPIYFLREVQNSITKNGWSDEITMHHVVPMLRGEAADWFHVGLPTERSLPGFERIKKSWKLFLPIFRAKWAIKEDIYNLSVSRALDSQRKGESAEQYLQRIILAMGDFAFVRYKPGQRAPADQEGCMKVTPVPAPVVQLLATPANLQTVDECIANGEFRGALDQYRRLIDVMTQNIIACGFSTPALREEASRLLRSEPDLAKFSEDMREVICQKEAAGVHVGARQVQPAKVAGVQPEEEEDEAEVAAFKKSEKTDKPEDGRTNNFKKALKCHYCKRKGHFLRECRTRMANEAKKAKDSASSSSSATASAPSAPSLTAIVAQPSGNGSGPW